MSIAIRIKSQTLTDGSKVYDVLLGNLWIAARTEGDAHHMADKIMRAIDEHSLSAGAVEITD